MIFGRAILFWIVIFLVAICIFFLAQWLIPILFGLVGVDIPGHITNILALLLAIGVVVGGWRGWPGPVVS